MTTTPSVLFVMIGLCAQTVSAAGELSSRELEFFEARIRPVLAQDCYECHRSGETKEGGLALDHRRALLRGGDSGPVVVRGEPDSSLLIQAIRHEKEGLEMPKNGPKLEDSIIQDFEQWVAMGAPDPRDSPATEEEITEDTQWPAVMARRRNWWSFQPIREPQIPEAEAVGRDGHPIDRFVGARLAETPLELSERADRRVLIRRLSFALRGLPPTPAEIERFVSGRWPGGYDALVDDFLSSPRYGERWARHWMDWIRYAESHGSEGDPTIPNAWRYRDYLIRALNADVPYSQLIREHLAGDLLKEPRVNEVLGLNESAIGPAQLRMVFHGFAPTDALEEQVRFTTDQIDVISKAFMGLTLSCARCHDHKFDPISQEDFYAWYGIFASSRPGMRRVDVPREDATARRDRLRELKGSIKDVLITSWLEEADGLSERILSRTPSSQEELNQIKDDPFLHPLAWMQKKNPESFMSQWKRAMAGAASTTDDIDNKDTLRWDLTERSDCREWFERGAMIGEPAAAGGFAIAPNGETILTGIYPSGLYSHLTSSKDRGILLSPRVVLDQGYDLWVRVIGSGNAVFRYAVQDYPRQGTVYPVLRLSDGEWRWQKYSLDYWEGDRIHLELTTAADQPVLASVDADRSWFGIREAVLVKSGNSFPRAKRNPFLQPLASSIEQARPTDLGGLAACYETAAKDCLDAWRNGTISDDQALFLDQLVKRGLLPNTLKRVPAVRSLLERYRALEAKISVPTRAPGVLETKAFNQPLFKNGNHKKPGNPVPRRFLEAIDPTAYQTERSGRLELAEDLVRPDNPLTKRVIVNRVWHHLFGRGLVATPDNFGRLGKKPTHPELLDYLAARFGRQGWSLKRLIRFIVTSETWKQSSVPPSQATKFDPDNKLLSHFRVRRLEAEAIRDALLAVSGDLKEHEMFGPSVSGEEPRRSIYVRVKRNDLDPFLATFDAPVPSSTTGRRDTTNVPDQSLTLLNDEQVAKLAEHWAERLSQRPFDSQEAERRRIERMFVKALGRSPSAAELSQARRFVGKLEARREKAAAERARLEAALKQARDRIEALIDVANKRVLAEREQPGTISPASVPNPIASWDFEGRVKDTIGGLDGKLFGGARLDQGALVVGEDGGYMATEPLTASLRAKSLAAWVRLDRLDQQGGGVMTVQRLDGRVFDSIVFAERHAKRWMAGSEYFKRTQSFDGREEDQAVKRPVHLAIVYSEDGAIQAYRNGRPYGAAYQSNRPVAFEAGASQVLFGNRHGEPRADKLLKGRVLEAKLYDQALTEKQVAAAAASGQEGVTVAQRLASMSSDERQEYERLKEKVRQLEERRRALNEPQGLGSKWADLAHALFNLKEFIYIR